MKDKPRVVHGYNKCKVKVYYGKVDNTTRSVSPSTKDHVTNTHMTRKYDTCGPRTREVSSVYGWSK